MAHKWSIIAKGTNLPPKAKAALWPRSMGPEGGCAVSHVFLNAWGFESPDFVKWAMCISQTAVFGVSGPSFRKSNFSVLNSPIFSFRRKNTALSCGVFAVYLFCQHILEVPPRFELGVELLQSSALPLGYGTKNMERVTGLEPATSTLARWRSTR